MTFLQSMRRGLGRGLAGAGLCATLASFATTGARADGAAVWLLQGAHNTVYLAGSVHALPKGGAGLSPQLELAYQSADAIVMEVDLDDLNPLEAVEFVSSHGTLPEAQTLADVIGAKEYASIVKLAGSLDLPELAISRLEPWAAAMVLTQFALMKSGYDPQLGVDMQLAQRARQDSKPIDGLETVIDQLGIFDARSVSEQSKFLIDAAHDVPKMHGDLERLVSAWRHGDLKGLEREFRKERAQAPALYDELLGARNRKWLPKIEALLQSERNYLVLVGTLHFVGQDSLLDLLGQAGHKPVALTLGTAGAAR